MTRTQLRPHLLVSYHGGGYDGCIWETNYAFVDPQGVCHQVFSTGCFGCKDEQDVLAALAEKHTDAYDLSLAEDRARFCRLEPVDRVRLVAAWLQERGIEYPLYAKCSECGEPVDVSEALPEGLASGGGIELHHTKFVCVSCHEAGTCHHCESFAGAGRIDEASHYCGWCHHRYYMEGDE